MLGAGVDLQLLDLGAREAVAGQHPLDGLAQHLGRPALELVAQRPALEPARVARVAVVHLRVELVTGDVDLLRVHDDDEIARVDVRGVLRLALAAQRVGDLRSKTSEGLALGVYDVPAALDLAGFCVPGLLHKKRRTHRPPGRNRSSPARNSVAPPWLGWRTYGASSAACATRPTAITVRPRASSRRNGREASTSVRVGRRFVSGCSGRCGWVGTTFQQSVCCSRPSSASVRRTIVAVASAGPRPVSWRSDVNGIPDTRAPRWPAA